MINGINNFIKIKNKNYCLNIITFQTNIYVCDNNIENENIDTYLVNNLKKSNEKYNFFIPQDSTDLNNIYYFYKKILKIKDNLPNINFVKYYEKIDDYRFMIEITRHYINDFYFTKGLMKTFIDKLNEMIEKLNIILESKNKLPKNIKKDTKIILEYIYINYFKNKIKLIIHDTNELIKFCEKNINLIKYESYITDESFDVLKHIFKMKHKLFINIDYLISFVIVFNIIKDIYTSEIKNNIIYVLTEDSNLLIYLLLTNLNFEIIEIGYSDKIIDNNDIETTNKMIKNIDILNESSILFLKNYLTNSTNCVKITDILSHEQH